MYQPPSSYLATASVRHAAACTALHSVLTGQSSAVVIAFHTESAQHDAAQEKLNQHLVGCCISPVMQIRSFFAGQYGSKSYLLIFSTVLSSLATFFSKSLAMFRVAAGPGCLLH